MPFAGSISSAAPSIERLAAGLRAGGDLLLLAVVLPALAKRIPRRGEAADVASELLSRVALLHLALSVGFLTAALTRASGGAPARLLLDGLLAASGPVEAALLAPALQRARQSAKTVEEAEGRVRRVSRLFAAAMAGGALAALLLLAFPG